MFLVCLYASCQRNDTQLMRSTFILVFKLYVGFDKASLTDAVGSSDNVVCTSPLDKNSISPTRS